MNEESNKIIELFCADIINKLDDVQYKFEQLKEMGLLDDLLNKYEFGMTVHVHASNQTIAECVIGKGPAVQKCMLGLLLRVGLLTKGEGNAED